MPFLQPGFNAAKVLKVYRKPENMTEIRVARVRQRYTEVSRMARIFMFAGNWPATIIIAAKATQPERWRNCNQS